MKSCVYFENSQRCSVTSCTHQSVWQPNYSPLCAINKPLLRCHPSSFTSCVSLEQQAPPLLSPSIIHFLCLLNNNIWHRKWSHLLFCHTPDGYMHNTNISEKFQRLKQKKYFFVIYREGIFASRAQRSEAKIPPYISLLMFPFKNYHCLTHSAAVVFTEMKTSVSSVRLLTVLCYAMIVMIMISSPWTWAGRYLRTATKVHERRMRVYVRCAVTKHKDQNRNQSRNGFFSQVKNTPTEESYFLPLCFVTILSIQSSLQHFAHASNISKIRNLQS